MASAFSLNRVTLIGNIGQAPELRQTPQGTPVCKFSMATTQSYKDKNDNWQDKTEWHNIVLWSRLAERAANYLQKGSKVYVEGSLTTRTYEKDGVTRYFTEVRADNFINMEKTGGQGGGGGQSYGSYGGNQAYGGSPAGGGQAAPQQQQQQGGQMPPEEHIQDEFDDDVPF